VPNCRSISPEAWTHARESLVFYFSRRHARLDAEDLAQDTLLSIWNREDYEFDREEDFLKICYGFARRKLQEGYRESRRHEGSVADDSLSAPQHSWGSQRAAESRMLLEQVCEIGQTQLRNKEWQIIRQAADSDSDASAQELSVGVANNMRVRLHRARKKLAKLVGLGGR
jgi:DNA-directed RNA polymerase specialized sigma24 family protein